MPGRLRVTLRKSPISYAPKARGTLRALGLGHVGASRELPDNPAVRGQVIAVRYLLEVEELPAAGRGPRRPTSHEESPE